MIATFIACEKNEPQLSDNSISNSLKNEIQLVNIGNELRSTSSDELVLKFNDKIAYLQTINYLNKLSKAEREKWIASFDGFKSLMHIYSQAMDDAALLDESKESYLAFKDKYDDVLYFPMYNEDLGAYLPIENLEEAILVNENGKVIIEDSLFNLKTIDTYSELQKTGQAYYNDSIANNKSESTTRSTLMFTPEHHVTGVNQRIGTKESGWIERDSRALNLNFSRRTSNYPSADLIMRLDVAFRKKVWYGWTNYSSKTNTDIYITIEGRNYTFNSTREGFSSHDWIGSSALPMYKIYNPYNDPANYFTTPQINASFTVSYQGFALPYSWSCVLEGTTLY